MVEPPFGTGLSHRLDGRYCIQGSWQRKKTSTRLSISVSVWNRKAWRKSLACGWENQKVLHSGWVYWQIWRPAECRTYWLPALTTWTDLPTPYMPYFLSLPHKYVSYIRFRNSCKYVVYKDKKEFTADMKNIYNAPNKEAAAVELNNLEKKWEGKYSYTILSWKNNWDDLTVFFQFPLEIRKIIYTTNLIENLNGKIRKYTKSKRCKHPIKYTL